MSLPVVDFRAIRRAMAITPAKPCRLTRNGLVYDHVRYRWNPDAVEDVLDAGDRSLPASLRTEGTAMVLVWIRVWDDDIDMIEVYDPETNTFHEMWSTEPEYTSGLSRWEHHQYLAMATAGAGGAMTDADRLHVKGRSLKAEDSELGGRAFRDRAAPSALVEAEGYRRASGARARNPGFAAVPELVPRSIVGGSDREDMPRPPPQPSRREGRVARSKRTAPGRAPERDPDYGYARLPRLEPESSKQDGTGGSDDEAEGHAAAAEARRSRWEALAASLARETGAAVKPAAGEQPLTGDYHLRDDLIPDEDETGDHVEHEEDEE